MYVTREETVLPAILVPVSKTALLVFGPSNQSALFVLPITQARIARQRFATTLPHVHHMELVLQLPLLATVSTTPAKAFTMEHIALNVPQIFMVPIANHIAKHLRHAMEMVIAVIAALAFAITMQRMDTLIFPHCAPHVCLVHLEKSAKRLHHPCLHFPSPLIL